MFEVQATGHVKGHEAIFRTPDLKDAKEEYKRLRAMGFHLVSLRMVPGTWSREERP